MIKTKPPLYLRYAGVPPLVMPGSEDAELWVSGLLRLSVITSRDGGSLHLSIAHPERYPTWDEIVTAWRWYAGPDVEGVMVVPRESEHVNLHSNCFHVWQSACGREGRG
jgi:hypothetical protein